jgi:hypothetical protein
MIHKWLLLVILSESKALSDAISSTRSLTAMSTVVRYGLIHLEIEEIWLERLPFGEKSSCTNAITPRVCRQSAKLYRKSFGRTDTYAGSSQTLKLFRLRYLSQWLGHMLVIRFC